MSSRSRGRGWERLGENRGEHSNSRGAAAPCRSASCHRVSTCPAVPGDQHSGSPSPEDEAESAVERRAMSPNGRAAAPRLGFEVLAAISPSAAPSAAAMTCSTHRIPARSNGCRSIERSFSNARPAAHGRAGHHERGAGNDARCSPITPRMFVRLRDHPELHNWPWTSRPVLRPVAHIGGRSRTGARSRAARYAGIAAAARFGRQPG